MAHLTHTFRLVFPDAAINDYQGGGAVESSPVVPAVHVLVSIESSVLADVKTEAERRGWEYVGVGNLIPI